MIDLPTEDITSDLRNEIEKNEYNISPCAFCKNKIKGAAYIWIITTDNSRNTCCLDCRFKKTLNSV